MRGGVSTWADQLVRNIPEHRWHVVTLVGRERASVWEPPANLASTTLVPMWDPPALTLGWWGRRTRQRRADVREALRQVWRAALPYGPEQNMERLRPALQELARSDGPPLAQLLLAEGSTPALLEAWARHRRERPYLPPLPAALAAKTSAFADRMLAVLGARWPKADVSLASSNGPAALLSMARLWQDGTPMVLAEHGVHLRERYLALAATGWAWSMRYTLMAFSRAVCRLAYREASLVTPVSDFNGRWAARLGADPTRIHTIPNGVEPASFPLLPDEPAEPVVSFVGRIDPLKDLVTLVEAFAVTRGRVPAAKLRLFGPTPVGNEAYRARVEARIAELSLIDAVVFEGPTPSANPAIEAGQVVVLSSISEGLPFTVLEAMMSGRPTVNTDVGGVGECTDRDGSCGVVVPPRDPAALGNALADLLLDAPRRHAMGAAAHERALANFTLQVCAGSYREALESVAAGRPFRVRPQPDPVRPAPALAEAS
ncbi:MAG: GT4 family glycosyltransferase PelF [Propionibacteriaceae bacterium]|nr:GT4 family glycosyltransferase PelF [Propionibacteriaceae bacterium]